MTAEEQLLSQLQRQKITKTALFSIPGAKNVFVEFYKSIVLSRKTTFEMNDDLKACLNETASWVENPEKTPGLMLMGTIGNGKTTTLKALQLLVSCCNQTDPKALDYYGNPANAYLWYVNAIDLCTMKVENPQNFKKYKTCGLLAIDDLGTEPSETMSFGNVQTPLTEVLYERYEMRLLTIITTNLLPSDISSRYGDRISDRFRETMTRVVFPDKSFRKG